jgi:hypothetical protein
MARNHLTIGCTRGTASSRVASFFLGLVAPEDLSAAIHKRTTLKITSDLEHPLRKQRSEPPIAKIRVQLTNVLEGFNEDPAFQVYWELLVPLFSY